MVVLAASICTRGGKALLSRQFRDVTKDRITALLANFPSLISNSGSQHTTVEDEHVRYVYQPLEEFYIVLITTKHSNILQDIDTLHLFASTVSNMLRVVDEREIFENAFQILSAFDEIINLGFKENLTLSQVQTFLEMDSHEEKIQEIIERNKELEATEERKRRAKEIQRKELARRNLEQTSAPIINSSFGYDSYQNQFNSSNQSTYQPTPSIEQSVSNTTLSSKPVSSRGGLQLGKKTGRVAEQNQPLLTQNQPSFSHAAATQVQQQIPNQPASFPVSQTSSPAPQTPKVPNNGILITVNEKVTAELTREGSVVLSEVKGDLQLRINNTELASSKILLKTGDKSSGVQYKTHPNVDRNLFTQQNVIGLKDKTKPFPSNDQSLGVLRWRAVGKNDDSSLLPIVITAWVTSNDGNADVTLEYELTSDYVESHQSQGSLENIKILVPLPSPDVNLKDESGNIGYDVTEYGVVFSIESIPLDNPQGSFEFSIPSPDEDSLFPMELQFDINKTDANETDTCLGKVQVLDIVSNNEDEESLPFDLHSNLSSDGYQVS
jgi:hypothetical protein